MKFLREIHEKQAELFKKGAKLERLYPLFEAHDTFVFTPDSVTKTGAHVRDGLDLKRMMSVVVVALLPCMFMAMYNTGYQANLAIQSGAWPLDNWQSAIYNGWLGFEYNTGFIQCMVHGLLYYLPIYVVTLAAGGAMEALFSVVRKHEINEGFLVTSALLPLTLPATQPLWQVAMAIIFGVVLGKEIYGGTGMNWLNPALTARAFLFFAYPAQISGDSVWIAAQTGADGRSGATALASADGYSGATWLSRVAGGVTDSDGVIHKGVDALPQDMSWMDAFIGFIPGSMGETSALACLFGAVVLILSKVGSWRTIAGCLAGSACMSIILYFNAPLGGSSLLSVPFYWHWVLGGFAFATVFMATDPVSSAFTDTGKLIYGFCIGVMGIIIRVLNPAYPEGFMMAILFMNMFAPLIDHFVVQANIKRRAARYAA